MWVRSQNKNNLIYCTAFYIEDNNIFANSNQIVYGLGRYETEQRVLEVLGQIQDAIFNLENDKVNCSTQNGYTTVYNIYEMPQK